MMMPATTTNTPADCAAYQAIRALLDGAPFPAAIKPADLGPWAENVRLLREAEAQGGAVGLQRAFVALSHHEPALVALLASGEPAAKVRWTVEELYAATLPSQHFIVPGLVPVGLNLLGGRPKTGKSVLAQQIAGAVGTGGTLLGITAQAGRVLYLGLEDSPNRLCERLQKQGVPAGAAITYVTTWAPLCEQGLTDLYLEALKGYSLIVVDTLSRAMGRADHMDATDMTLLLSSLQQLALRRNLAILLVDHHRKLESGGNHDPIDDILGATAKAGVVDAALGLYRPRHTDDAVLKVTGRDLCERELALHWDAATFSWTCQGNAHEVSCTQRQQEVIDALATLGKAQLRDIADATGQDRSNLFKRLQSLASSGIVKRANERGQVYYSMQ